MRVDWWLKGVEVRTIEEVDRATFTGCSRACTLQGHLFRGTRDADVELRDDKTKMDGSSGRERSTARSLFRTWERRA